MNQGKLLASSYHNVTTKTILVPFGQNLLTTLLAAVLSNYRLLTSSIYITWAHVRKADLGI